MLKKIIIGILLVIIVFVAVVATRPADFRVSRSANIAAPVDVVFGNVNELKKWEAWSPWAKLDPNCKMTYEGPASGAGAGYSWDGNKEVGAGKMTIIECVTNEMLRMKLEFIRPFESVNTVEFTFKSADANGQKTEVTWTMSGKNNFVGKAFSLFVDCDKMVGGDFEKGLAAIKSICETAVRP